MLFLRLLRPLLTPLLLDRAVFTSITGIAVLVGRLGFEAGVAMSGSSGSTLRIDSPRWSSNGVEVVRDRGGLDVLDHRSAIVDDGPPRSAPVIETADASALCLRNDFSASVISRCRGFLSISQVPRLKGAVSLRWTRILHDLIFQLNRLNRTRRE